jgi:hypothetical protein
MQKRARQRLGGSGKSCLGRRALCERAVHLPVAVRWCFSQTCPPPRLAVPSTLEQDDDEALAEGSGEMAQVLHCPALYRGQFIG